MNAVTRQRLLHQRLIGSRFAAPEAVVAWLGGVQAQDEAWARWSVGLRLPGSSDADVRAAVANGAIVRTWAMRGTLHYLAAPDVGWLVPLLAPSVIAQNRRRYDQLGLDGAIFAKSNEAIERALSGGGRMDRAELVRVLAHAGVGAAGQRAPYLLQRASLDGLICHGPPRGHEATFVLRRDWVPRSATLDRDDALAELARRYFAGHGPATWHDFGWWSGLPAADVRAARTAIGAELERYVGEGGERWVAAGTDDHSPGERVAHLLPPFDELLLGYRDRGPSLRREHAARVNPGGGMPKATVAVDGEVVSTWGRTIRAGRWDLTLDLFRTLDGGERRLVEVAAARLGAFFDTPVAVAGPAG